MSRARSYWFAGWLLMMLAGCAVGGTADNDAKPRRDAGSDATGTGDDEDAGEDVEDDDGGPGGNGDEGEAGSGGTGGEDADDAGPDADGTGGAGGADDGGTGGSDGGAGGGGVCSPPNGGACDPVAKCGCSANQACDFLGVDGKTACLSAGTGAPYAKCDNSNGCQAGYSCVSDTCRPFCKTAADCPGSGRTCDQVSGGSPPQNIPGFLVCSAQCDPMNPGAVCGPGVTCLAFPGNDQTDCFVGGTATSGACAGKAPDECAPGYVCAGPQNGTATCRKWCRVGKNDCGGKACSGFSPKNIVGGVEYGVCQ